MARLIDADVLKKCLEKERSYGGVKTDEFDKGYDLGVETAIEMLDNVPTVECTWIISGKRYGKKEEALKYLRPHGEWIKSDIPESVLAKCSICGFNCGVYTHNYCPNCGADMRGEE